MHKLDLAVTASFMWNGALETGTTADELYGMWGMGAFELHQELSQYALLSENILDAIPRKNFPGVYDYEVSEPFGMWFAEQLVKGSVPTVESGTNELIRLVTMFFAKGGMWVDQLKLLEDFK